VSTESLGAEEGSKSKVKKLKIVDLFCGAGGETTGILQACRAAGFDFEMLAVNHWTVAIETHSKNHPEVKHLCESIQNVDPRTHITDGRVNLLWASPECTHFSNARGGMPKSDQSRASAWLVLKWASDLYIDRIIIENVKEFLDWGPLGVDSKPLQSKKGETFRAWVDALKSLGYRVDWRVLCAADFGAPTTRRRLFVQAVRGRGKIVWPEHTHAETAGLFGEKIWVPARNIIDWSISGKSIFKRSKPLAENTLRRIEAGIRRFWGKWAEPFLVVVRGASGAVSIDKPLPTVTCSGAHYGLVEPLILHQMNGMDCVPTSKPLPTVTTRCGHALIEPFITAIGQTSAADRSRSINEPLSTVVTKAEHCLVEPFLMKYYGNSMEPASINQPLTTITCKDRFAIIEGVPHQLDIRFRMLLPHELSAAQSFPRDYHFAGNRADQVKQIGNAVPPMMARALAEAALMN
jgi:DNA (cytosine-5)-methyltransferase 1